MRTSTESGGKIAENRMLTDVNRRYSAVAVDRHHQCRRLKKGPGILHLSFSQRELAGMAPLKQN